MNHTKIANINYMSSVHEAAICVVIGSGRGIITRFAADLLLRNAVLIRHQRLLMN